MFSTLMNITGISVKKTPKVKVDTIFLKIEYFVGKYGSVRSL